MSGIVGKKLGRGSGIITATPVGADAVDSANIADDAIDSEHYAATSIDTAHIATNQIDETLIKDAFVGDFTDATVTASDYFLHGDATDSGNTKKDTVQGILDLAGGGAWNIIGTAVADDDASLTITGLDTSVYETFAIRTTNLVGASDATSTYVRLGDSGGIDSGASDYAWWNLGARAGSHSPGYNGSTGHAQMVVDNSMGTAAGEVCSITMFLSAASSGDYPLLQFISVGSRLASLPDARWVQGCGVRASAINVTQIQVLASSGNLTSGRMTVWGIAHA